MLLNFQGLEWSAWPLGTNKWGTAIDFLGLLAQAITDGATAATAESAAVIAGQQEKAAAARRQGAAGLPPKDFVGTAAKETCSIHGAVLEENHGMEAAFPQRMLEDWLRLFHELFASAEATLARVLRHIWVEVAKLPGVLYDKCLASIALATSSKWEIIYTVCFKLLPILQPHGMHELSRHRATPMLQLFLEKCRAFLRGDLSVDGTKVSATVVEKVRWLSGVLYEGQLVSGIYLMVDVWEQSYHKFFKFAKSPSQYGNFDSPHLRHMIAERPRAREHRVVCGCAPQPQGGATSLPSLRRDAQQRQAARARGARRGLLACGGGDAPDVERDDVARSTPCTSTSSTWSPTPTPSTSNTTSGCATCTTCSTSLVIRRTAMRMVGSG